MFSGKYAIVTWETWICCTAENKPFKESVLEALWDGYIFVGNFFPGFIFGETGIHLFSLFYLFLRTNNNSASWWHEKPEKIFFGISPGRSGPPAVGQAVVGEEWEVGEKPSTFLGSHEGGVGQENTYKGWNNMLRTTLHPDGDDDYEYEQLSMRANDCKY